MKQDLNSLQNRMRGYLFAAVDPDGEVFVITDEDNSGKKVPREENKGKKTL